MRILTSTNEGWLRNTTATGLVPLLLLASLSGCTARHMPDWSTVQAVKPGTKTEVQLYEDEILLGHGEKIKGRFHSTTDDSVTLQIKDKHVETFKKTRVRKVLRHRPFWNRTPAWATLIASLTAVTMIEMLTVKDEPSTPLEKYGALLTVALPLTATVFYGSRMEGIYEVPPKHRYLHRSPRPAPIKTKDLNRTK